ncbi:MAG TPA: ubiquitin-like domain-containing protein [Ktedonobacteraceae bacterium]|nr:ubiquitin-like domain-containing protein [Ktedonobacteraceae bacterium]
MENLPPAITPSPASSSSIPSTPSHLTISSTEPEVADAQQAQSQQQEKGKSSTEEQPSQDSPPENPLGPRYEVAIVMEVSGKTRLIDNFIHFREPILELKKRIGEIIEKEPQSFTLMRKGVALTDDNTPADSQIGNSARIQLVPVVEVVTEQTDSVNDALMDSEEIAQPDGTTITLMFHPPEGEDGSIIPGSFDVGKTIGEAVDWYASRTLRATNKYALWKNGREMQCALDLRMYINMGIIKNDDHVILALPTTSPTQ